MASLLPDIAVWAVATVSALLIPWVALRRCAGCGGLALRAHSRPHPCPSRHHARVARRWTSMMLLWAVAALLWAVAPPLR
jgi:hypothetical protein